MSLEKYVVRNKDMLWRMVGNEVFIINKDGTVIHQLNIVGGEIWKSSEGNLTIRQIIENICNSFEIGEDQVKSDTIAVCGKHVGPGSCRIKGWPGKSVIFGVTFYLTGTAVPPKQAVIKTAGIKLTPAVFII